MIQFQSLRRRGHFILAITFAWLGFAATISTSQSAHAAKVPRAVLKSYFQTGDRPTQSQFADMIDSALNLTDDGLTAYLTLDSSGRAARFTEGQPVGPALAYTESSLVTGLSDDWLGQAGFLPVEFIKNSQTYYGYLQAHAGAPGSANPFAFTVDYFVYEDQPNTLIITSQVPEPSALALAVVGLLGLWGFARRRRR